MTTLVLRVPTKAIWNARYFLCLHLGHLGFLTMYHTPVRHVWPHEGHRKFTFFSDPDETLLLFTLSSFQKYAASGCRVATSLKPDQTLCPEQYGQL